MSNLKRPKHGRTMPGFEAYAFTKSSKVWSDHVNRYRVPHVNKKGYHMISLTRSDGKKQTFRLHRIIGKLFVPNPKNLPECHHRGHDLNDNRACALEWCDRKTNMQYRKEAKRPRRRNVPKNKKLPCKNSTTSLSYALFKETIGPIPDGRIFTGFFFDGKHYETLNEIAKLLKHSFTKVKRMFNLGKIVFCLDDEPQPLTEGQKKFIAKEEAKQSRKPQRLKRYNPIDYNFYNNICSQ